VSAEVLFHLRHVVSAADYAPRTMHWLSKAAGWTRRTWSTNAGWLAALGFLGIAVVLGFVAAVQTIKLDGRHCTCSGARRLGRSLQSGPLARS
jgi:hypothetical protein